MTLAVLDTGVDTTHPELASHLMNGYDFVDNDSDPSEVGIAGIDRAYGHGTFITGLVALAAPDARIMPVRVLDPNGTGDVWRLAKSMVWAAANGADVINLSLGTNTRTHVANELIGDLAVSGRGIVVVAAAGNAASNQPAFPAGEIESTGRCDKNRSIEEFPPAPAAGPARNVSNRGFPCSRPE